ncbi:hypothetical protein Mhypo_03450 [Meiothermus hypogaeus]|uniref:Secreted protein n=1 Tax=Meiothermus hypogaeus TaxID=884155 RepID=A0ABX9ML23_9DEIN|nr:hypothetical protein Mhypo_03450 [Meiothermus hypogaeus]
MPGVLVVPLVARVLLVPHGGVVVGWGRGRTGGVAVVGVVVALRAHAGVPGLGLGGGAVGAVAGVAPLLDLGLEPLGARHRGVVGEVGDAPGAVEVDLLNAFQPGELPLEVGVLRAVVAIPEGDLEDCRGWMCPVFHRDPPDGSQFRRRRTPPQVGGSVNSG